MKAPVTGSPTFIGNSLRWTVPAGASVVAPSAGSLVVDTVSGTSASYRLAEKGLESRVTVSPALPVVAEIHHAEGGLLGTTDAPSVVTLQASRHGRPLTGAQLAVEVGLAAAPASPRPGGAAPAARAARPGGAAPAAARAARPGGALARAIVSQAQGGGGLGLLLLLGLAGDKGRGSSSALLPLAGLALLGGLGAPRGRAQGAVKVGNSRGNVANVNGRPVAWGAKASPGLLQEAVAIAARHGLDPGWLLSSWMNESGLSPASHNQIGGGLFGLLWQYLPQGVSPQQWLHMSAEQQARYYEQLYGRTLDKLKSVDDVRLLGWGRLDLAGAPDSTVVWRRGEPAYQANVATDTNRKGYITRGDLVAHGRALYQEGLQ